jgi:hypothetical protein
MTTHMSWCPGDRGEHDEAGAACRWTVPVRDGEGGAQIVIDAEPGGVVEMWVSEVYVYDPGTLSGLVTALVEAGDVYAKSLAETGLPRHGR